MPIGLCNMQFLAALCTVILCLNVGTPNIVTIVRFNSIECAYNYAVRLASIASRFAIKF